MLKGGRGKGGRERSITFKNEKKEI